MQEFPPPHLSRFDCTYPTTNGGIQNGNSAGICTQCIHVFTRLAPICMLSRCLLTKISAQELIWKLTKRVRCWLGSTSSSKENLAKSVSDCRKKKREIEIKRGKVRTKTYLACVKKKPVRCSEDKKNC